MRFSAYKTLAVAAALSVSAGAYAGPYANDLAKCLVNSTSQQDRQNLVRWVFAAAAAHPAVKSIANVSPEQLDQANHQIGTLFTKLLTESCRDETQKAMKYEGQQTLQTSFQVLGTVAGKELFSSPDVGNAMAGLKKYLDEKKLSQVIPKE